ncbi:MAG: dual-specificity RNA methyltransferase RlmN [Planctomycetota bacterium]|jgi:23S rRNA (adenine2503-C2)-methyltransferase
MANFSVFDQTLSELKGFFSASGHKPFRADQVYKWVFEKDVFDFSEMTNLPSELRLWLSTNARIDVPEIIKTHKESSTSKKYVLKLRDDYAIESVLLRDGDRRTLCLSTQVGCPVHCEICASGRHKFVRNLDASEIIGQYLAIKREKSNAKRISNLVFMGMGEPLLNAGAVLTAIRIFNNPAGANIGARKITISTVGIAKGLERLQELDIQFNLAVSLHAVDPKTRKQLVPGRKTMDPMEIREFCSAFARRRQREVTLEYVLVRDVNDSESDAAALAEYARDLPCNINLIPLNPHSSTKFESPTPAKVKRFQRTLEAAGVKAPVRKSAGSTIHAGCGQLVLHQ